MCLKEPSICSWISLKSNTLFCALTNGHLSVTSSNTPWSNNWDIWPPFTNQVSGENQHLHPRSKMLRMVKSSRGRRSGGVLDDSLIGRKARVLIHILSDLRVAACHTLHRLQCTHKTTPGSTLHMECFKHSLESTLYTAHCELDAAHNTAVCSTNSWYTTLQQCDE